MRFWRYSFAFGLVFLAPVAAQVTGRLTGTVVASQALVRLLFGVSRLDPVTYLSVIALLGGMSLIACGVPAWRGAQVDPAVTLRQE